MANDTALPTSPSGEAVEQPPRPESPAGHREGRDENRVESGADNLQDKEQEGEAGEQKQQKESQQTESERGLTEKQRKTRLTDFGLAAVWQSAVFGSAIFTAALAIVLYSRAGRNSAETFGTLCLFGAAAVVVGAFFGFLFGVPRSSIQVNATEGDGKDKKVRVAAQAVPSVTGHISANTNLEQISDWLTKILVGATLTQLGNIPAAAAALFTGMAAAVGNRPSAVSFVGALTVFSALMGFMFGWLVTRSYVGWMINTIDKKLEM